MSSLKPVTLWAVATGPNAWKVAIVLEELQVPYTLKIIDLSEVKSAPYTDVCVNGRVPTIEDPNTGVTIWESGAIIQYLVEKYDKEGKLDLPAPQKYELWQWLAFQISGQGPYFGQAGWFAMFHPEKLPSAIERYLNETHRVVGVLDKHLSKQTGPYLVGDKVTFADLSFVVWNVSIGFFMDKGGATWDESKYPHYQKWQQNMLGRPAVKKVLGEMNEQMMKKYGQS